jgi:hypothetical protein
MLGLADRSRVLDLMDRIIAADHKAALNEASALLEQGAEPGAEDGGGVTPLHYAAAEEHTRCALLLLAHGAPADVVDGAGRTPADCLPGEGGELLALLGEADPGGAAQLLLTQGEAEEEDEFEEERLALTDGRFEAEDERRAAARGDGGYDRDALQRDALGWRDAEAPPPPPLPLGDGREAGLLPGEDEAAAKRRMATDLAALGFSDAEVASYLSTLSLEAGPGAADDEEEGTASFE